MIKPSLVIMSIIVSVLVVLLTLTVFGQAVDAKTAVEKDWVIGILVLVVGGLLTLMIHQHIAADSATAKQCVDNTTSIAAIEEILKRIEGKLDAHLEEHSNA